MFTFTYILNGKKQNKTKKTVKQALNSQGMSVISPTSRFANRDFANVLGRFANVVVT